MGRDTLTINKAMIPYDFNIVLGDEEFNLYVDYNNTGGFFTVALKKGDEVLCAGEPIVYGRRLFEDVWKIGFPVIDIVAFDPSGEFNAVTFANLCEEVLLIVDNDEESVIEGD